MTTRLGIFVGLTRLDPAAYEGWAGECPGCDRDVARMAAACHDRGFDGVTALANRFADHPFIRPAFEGALGALDPDDLLVLFNSGHGGQREDVDGDEVDGLDETLCWWSGEVADDTIREYLERITCRVLFIADTCHSGTSSRGRRGPVALSERATRGCRGSVLHFGGCADNRYSYGEDEGGWFTMALLEGLSSSRRPITYREWFARAARRMPRRQRPVCEEWGDGPSFLDREALT